MWPEFGADEIQAVSRVLASGCVNYWTGSEGRDFEREFADWCGASHAVALANGTVAIDLALRVLGIARGDEVIVTPRTFLASASAIVNAGARPVFADVDRNSQNITPETAQRVLSSRTRAILCVHLAGWPCDMEAFGELAAMHRFELIEDCAQAHGGAYRGRSVGSFGHTATWSFCQDKIMTTGGEGGMLTANDRDIWSKAWSYKDHGKSWEAVYEREHAPGFRWLHESFGTNWRMTEMQAAIGRVQLQKMTDWHVLRRRNATEILSAARECAIYRVPEAPAHVEHAWYKAYVFVEPTRLARGWDRDRIIAEISARGVPCGSGSCSEVYLEKAFEGTGLRPAHRLPVAKELGETSLMFMVHPTLTEAEIARTCQVIRDVGASALADKRHTAKAHTVP